LNTLYRELVKYAVNNEFPKKKISFSTRMAKYHAEGNFLCEVINPTSQVVCVNLARAGTIPSQICFDAFNYFLNPEGIRQDHISINRKTDLNDQVIGTDLGGVKIGGKVEGKYLIIPDPMGATGSTLESAMAIYSKLGKIKKVLALHLIVTPEYLKKITTRFPDLAVYAIRLDRGLSSKKVLGSIPGTFWAEERGLNDKQYIVPGAGGLGEVINNAEG
jgi:uracil phosphoribosyltransferase